MSQLLSGSAAVRAFRGIQQSNLRSASLDAIRRGKHQHRSVGAKAWQDRSVGGNVLALPGRTVGHGMRRTGQEDIQQGYVQSEGARGGPTQNVPSGMPNRSNPDMCSGKERYLSETLTIDGGASETFKLTTPGAFCPKWMYITSDGPLSDLQVTAIESGLEKQIISGDIPASYYSVVNPCCPVACFPCMCLPGVPLTVTVENTGTPTTDLAEVTVAVVGDYYKVCPPNADQMIKDMAAACGNAKVIGFSSAIDDSTTVDFSLETPGKFCPSNIFLVASVGITAISLESAEVALEENIIGDGFPIQAWTEDNEACCLPFCIQCLCMPGVPLNLSFTQGAGGDGAQVLSGVVAGSYSPAC